MNPTPLHSTRRQFLALSAGLGAAGALAPRLAFGAGSEIPPSPGVVVGDAVAAKVGEQVLRDGGNAIDAAIASAFAAGICTPRNCGVGGYGGHAVVALADGRTVAAIDFNSTAPAAARPDMFPRDPQGKVIGQANTFGWLAAGVPGTLAGLELTLRRFGTRSLRQTISPAIALCESGRHVAAVKGIDDVGPASDPPAEQRRNRALLGLLQTFAARDSVDSFYRADLAGTVADAFQRHGGLVTRADLAAYRAREVKPVSLEWNGATIHTAPLTATGLLLVEAMSALKHLNWAALAEPERQHARLEALRLAWADRFATWGDPDHVAVPAEKFVSRDYGAQLAEKISAAVKARRPIPLEVDPSQAGGTTNLSAADRHGNVIAITLTHGGSFGARVVVPELGVVLGHGMSRFDPRPGLPNSVGPGKRPINNMCPTIVTRGGRPVLAVGGAGGTRIPNSVYEVLLRQVGLGQPLEAALAAPRLHTDGTLKLGLDSRHAPEAEAFYQKLGYTTTRGASALVSAVTVDAATGETRGLSVAG